MDRLQGPTTIHVLELRTDATVTLAHNMNNVALSISSTTWPLQCCVEGERLIIGDYRRTNRHSFAYYAGSLVAFLTCAHLLSKVSLDGFKSPLEVVARWYITFTLTCWAMQWFFGKVSRWIASWIQYSSRFTVHLVSLEELHLGSEGLLMLDQSLLSTHVDVFSTGGSLLFHSRDTNQRLEQQSVGLGNPIQTLRLYLSGGGRVSGNGALVPHLQVVTRAGSGSVGSITATQQLTVVSLGEQRPPYQVRVTTAAECVAQRLATHRHNIQ